MANQSCVNRLQHLPENVPPSRDPRTVAEEARDAVAHGAPAVHVHLKSPQGRDRLDAPHVAAYLLAVRQACPGTGVGITTGAWVAADVAERLRAIRSWTVLPDYASVYWHQDGADEVAAALLDRGVGVQAGIWGTEGLAAWWASPVRGRCINAVLELGDGDMEDRDAFVDQHLSLLYGVRDLEPGISVGLHSEEGSSWVPVASPSGPGWTPGSVWRTPPLHREDRSRTSGWA